MTNKEMYESLKAVCDRLAAALQNEAPAQTLRNNLNEASKEYVHVMMEIDNELQRRINEGQ